MVFQRMDKWYRLKTASWNCAGCKHMAPVLMILGLCLGGLTSDSSLGRKTAGENPFKQGIRGNVNFKVIFQQCILLWSPCWAEGSQKEGRAEAHSRKKCGVERHIPHLSARVLSSPHPPILHHTFFFPGCTSYVYLYRKADRNSNSAIWIRLKLNLGSSTNSRKIGKSRTWNNHQSQLKPSCTHSIPNWPW